MLSALLLNVCGYPTVPSINSTIGTLEKRRSKSFRTKDPSRFDYSSARKIGTILTLVVLTFMLSLHRTLFYSLVFTNGQTIFSLDYSSVRYSWAMPSR